MVEKCSSMSSDDGLNVGPELWGKILDLFCETLFTTRNLLAFTVLLHSVIIGNTRAKGCISPWWSCPGASSNIQWPKDTDRGWTYWGRGAGRPELPGRGGQTQRSDKCCVGNHPTECGRWTKSTETRANQDDTWQGSWALWSFVFQLEYLAVTLMPSKPMSSFGRLSWTTLSRPSASRTTPMRTRVLTVISYCSF